MDAMNRAKECRNEYFREWRKNNKAKVSEYNKRYWQRRAERQKKDQPKKTEDGKD